MVGGFDNEKSEGLIKLFRIFYEEKINEEMYKAYHAKCEFLQDIVFDKNEDFEGFEGPISCIIQSKLYKNILVTCYDGKVYALSSPNLSFYINSL